MIFDIKKNHSSTINAFEKWYIKKMAEKGKGEGDFSCYQPTTSSNSFDFTERNQAIFNIIFYSCTFIEIFFMP